MADPSGGLVDTRRGIDSGKRSNPAPEAMPPRKRQRRDSTGSASLASELSSGFDDESRSSPSTPFTPCTPASPSRKAAPREKKFSCTYRDCGKAFTRPARLEEHLRSHTNSRPFSCPHSPCEKAFIRQSHLNHHVKSAHTQIRDHVCDVDGCEKSFATGTRLRRHKEAHEKRETFRCSGYPPCCLTFRKHATLQRHVEAEHLGRSPFHCNAVEPMVGARCTESFDTAAKLRRHERIVHGGVSIICTLCSEEAKAQGDNADVGFPGHRELQEHIRTAHPPICGQCSFVARSTAALEAHVDTHHSGNLVDDRRVFVCPRADCERSFTRQSNLNVHVKSFHEKQKPFVCGDFDLSQSPGLEAWDNQGACHEAFAHKRSLEQHVRTHHLGQRNDRAPSRKTKRSGSAIALLTDGKQQERPRRKALLCTQSDCAEVVADFQEFRTHLILSHGLHGLELEEAYAEQEALHGGKFWLGGADEAEEYEAMLRQSLLGEDASRFGPVGPTGFAPLLEQMGQDLPLDPMLTNAPDYHL